MARKYDVEVAADFGKVQVRLSFESTHKDALSSPTKEELTQGHNDLIEILSRWGDFAKKVG